jgi:gamma-glutamyltranspeptidase/glutathione hydrolase
MFAPLFIGGRVLELGSRYARPEFARTLRLLAAKGAGGFYEGEVAEVLVSVVRDRGGLMTLEDLRSMSYLVGHTGGADLARVPG